LLALTGDTADNVPGVPGIGPKTAAKLIQEYGSLDGILQNIDAIKGKRRENLEAARETLALSKALVTLKDDVDLSIPWETAQVRRLDGGRLVRLFQELGFRRYQDEIRKLAQDLGVGLEGDAAESGVSVGPVSTDQPASQ